MDQVHLGLADPPFVDLLDFRILSLILDIGVDAIGPEADFTIVKKLKSGQQVIRMFGMLNSLWSYTPIKILSIKS